MMVMMAMERTDLHGLRIRNNGTPCQAGTNIQIRGGIRLGFCDCWPKEAFTGGDVSG
jgi:hypothetical protein